MDQDIADSLARLDQRMYQLLDLVDTLALAVDELACGVEHLDDTTLSSVGSDVELVRNTINSMRGQ